MKLCYRFSGPITNNVIHSQVAGMLASLKKLDLDLDVLAWCGAGHACANRQHYQQAASELKLQLGDDFDWRLTIDRFARIDSWRKKQELKQSIRLANPANPVILQTRSMDIGLIMADLRQGKNLRFVKELRGDTEAEIEFLHKGQSAELEAKIRRHRSILARILAKADKVVCVSQILADRIAERYGLAKDRLHVTPCTADSNRFVPNSLLRSDKRSELGLSSQDLLLIYSGSLSKGWDQPEAIKTFLEQELSIHPQIKVLLLSPDQRAASQIISSLPAKRVFHRKASHLKIQDWLVAGDAALLLRAPHPLNEVASPTKAAEYVLCGLPLVISPGVGDYTSWVRKMRTGHVVEAGRPVPWDDLMGLEATEIRKKAMVWLDRDTHARSMIEVYRSI
jgi:glycosyltransferase involved in cell wall biosynthesis